ncbi:hypothetical protein BJ684DRAFT_16257 [Piptocephalis cylindrospora]|uniref:t-SNARE coiled-coil homology domain-containing protein n=1 Tax=Piptocephalis cylindrospora TaxID=1907219 RepID=A0A4P9Y3Q8_9FUNG|nr:hypothetical protein BJ684DRAFT_16257 [Piptocephalis cylindrospora]|eukprot:RKP13334.1 hypothetical protein BJ684DRAFT_16257 [Piptocephalis cylindrospora]
MDRTRCFRDLVQEKGKELGRPQNTPQPWAPTEAFTQEAYRISRKAYLARPGRTGGKGIGGVSSMTERERNELDRQAREIIASCSQRIRGLEAIVEASAKGTGAMGSLMYSILMDDGTEDPGRKQQDVERAHRASITLTLNTWLTQLGQQQRQMQEARLERQMERQKSRINPSISAMDLHSEESADIGATGDDGLTTEQRQALEQENDRMVEEFATALDQVRQTERSLTEISQIQSQLAMHLAQQTQETERLYAEATASTDRVKDGNFQLAEARKHMADTRKWILIFLLAASLILLFLDWYD